MISSAAGRSGLDSHDNPRNNVPSSGTATTTAASAASRAAASAPRTISTAPALPSDATMLAIPGRELVRCTCDSVVATSTPSVPATSNHGHRRENHTPTTAATSGIPSVANAYLLSSKCAARVDTSSVSLTVNRARRASTTGPQSQPSSRRVFCTSAERSPAAAGPEWNRIS
ncbi:hypothetical protein BBK82_24375 [Lentzea guizhouensis]|uniref:Uncharacterized protein n=1 Tax=Lentzea guizhouensis TaxID=1586287 RepID=A0A1B2HLY2_9PSEU|nr:hypothetical protein BBK82_24375 [Lentzea guizhouensis]